MVEAIRYNGMIESVREIVAAFPDMGYSRIDDTFKVLTKRGDAMTVVSGDWVIKGPDGDFWCCEGDLFENLYEAEK